jgi:thiol-disulfide isomerase/thioredoxin
VTVGTDILAGCTDSSSSGSDDDAASVDWRNTPLEDVTTGEEFTIGEFSVPTIVHTYATWCSTCRRQHQEFVSLHEELGDEIVLIDLNVDSGENADTVREHAERNGYDWRFAVLSDPVTEALVDEFGREVVSPPQSPIVLLCPDDSTHVLDKVTQAADLTSEIREQC